MSASYSCAKCVLTFESIHEKDRHYYTDHHSPSQPIITTGDPVNPAHYQGDYAMLVIEDFGLDFHRGQVVKYVLRAGKKEGNPESQDLKKALWYLQRRIANLDKS